MHGHRLKWHLELSLELILKEGFHLKFILFSRAIAGFGDGLLYPVNNDWSKILLQRYWVAFKRWSLSMWQRLPVRVCEAQWTMWQISHRWQNDTKIQCTNSKWTICEACHLRTLATSSSTCSPSIWPGALLLLSSLPSLPLPWPASFPCLRHLTGWPGEILVIVNSFHCLGYHCLNLFHPD